MSDPVAVVRRFNRSYTQRIGALEDSFLGLGMPLGPARLLFEIGAAPATTQALRERLGLDSGYLSRLLRRLENEGLIDVTPDPDDRRRRQVTLTEAGRERWRELERRSDDQARLIVDPLTQRQRERLARALSEADLLVRAATVSFAPTDPASPVARDVVGRYFAEIGRRFGFDSAADETEKDTKLLVPPTGVFVVAVSDGEPVACGGLQTLDTLADGPIGGGPLTNGQRVGELKRMWVHDDWRGAGLGSRLLRHLEDQARALGHGAVRLDTNAALAEAISMYQRAGYRPIARYSDNPWATHFFEKRLLN
ncbi:MAG TPA: helix-turn-helix domain-containing GNAT family N-acetyltransferase [Trebonia sp.]|jgi:DNA-binding MarR family transcriptional regulator/predicted N-acetyltransferase YhbS